MDGIGTYRVRKRRTAVYDQGSDRNRGQRAEDEREGLNPPIIAVPCLEVLREPVSHFSSCRTDVGVKV